MVGSTDLQSNTCKPVLSMHASTVLSAISNTYVYVCTRTYIHTVKVFVLWLCNYICTNEQIMSFGKTNNV